MWGSGMSRLCASPSTVGVRYKTSASQTAHIPHSEGSSVLLSFDHDDETGKDTGVAIIRFNRPEKLNALTVQVGEDLRQTCQLLSKYPPDQLRCVVIAGDSHDHAFSAGGDLDFLRDRTKGDPLENRQKMLEFYEYFLSPRKIGVPVLAAINGHAIGAGACLAVSCDLRPAIAPTAKIGFNFTKIGLHPGLGSTHFLAKAVGTHTASKLLLTGQLLKAKKAQEIGLADKVCTEPEEVLPETLRIARQIAENSPVAVRAYIQTMRTKEEGALRSALLDEANGQSISYGEEDMIEGLKFARDHKAVPAFSWRK